jgi:hypothetical protein
MQSSGYENNMIITETYQYNELLERMNRDECVLTPIFRDPYYHEAENVLLCVGVTFINNDVYIVSISHDDAPTFDVPKGEKVFTDIDVQILAYVNNHAISQKQLTPYVTNTYQQFSGVRDTNKIVPLTT